MYRAGTSALFLMLSVLVFILVGWGIALGRPSSAEASAKESEAQKAIRALLKEDQRLSNDTYKKVDNKDSSNDYIDAVTDYCKRSEKIDLSGCPATVRLAYKRHREAWEDYRKSIDTAFIRKLGEGVWTKGLFLKVVENGDKDKELLWKNINLKYRAVESTWKKVEDVAAENDVVDP